MATGSEKVAEQAKDRACDLLEQATTQAADASTQAVKDGIPKAREAAEAALTKATEAVTAASDAHTTKDAKAARQTAENAADHLQSADLIARDLVADAGDSAGSAAVSHVNEAIVKVDSVVKAALAKAISTVRAKHRPVTRSITIVIILIPVIGVVVWWLADWLGSADAGDSAAVLFGTAVMGAALLALLFLGGDHGLLKPVIGTDNRISTSKTQIGLWTVAVGFALAYLFGRVFWANAELDAVINSDRLDEYLILLGGPFAAGVLAKLTVSWRIDNGTLQKETANDTKVADVLKDDQGDTDLVDSQYLIFNFVALAYFAVALFIERVLPEIPTVLLGLTSGSAATYLAAKAATKNAPLITSVTPKLFRAGDRIVVGGSNFWTSGDTPPLGVSVGIDTYGDRLTPASTSTPGELHLTIPLQVDPGNAGLTVTSPAKVTSDSVSVEILEDKPVLVAAVAPLKTGEQATVLGRHLLSPGATTEVLSVLVGSMPPVEGTATIDSTRNMEQVQFTVPGGLTAGAENLTITRNGRSSEAIAVNVV